MSQTTAPAPSATRQARPTRPPVPWTVWAGIAGVILMTVWAIFERFGGIGFTLAPLFGEDIVRGREIIAEFFDPNWGFLDNIWEPFLETFLIAVIASVIGCTLALPLSLLASRATGVGPVVYGAVRGLNSVIRSLPDIAWGLLAVAAVGTGAMAGIPALIFFNIGVMVKLASETVDAVDEGPIEAATASGATRVEATWHAMVPQVLPNYLSYALYVFELNIRASVVIGLVGAGGIGNVITVQFARFAYPNLSVVIFVIFVAVYLIDRVSVAIRRRLI